jgi:hypothetical protein
MVFNVVGRDCTKRLRRNQCEYLEVSYLIIDRVRYYIVVLYVY